MTSLVTATTVLELHRRLVSIRSLSRQEDEVAAFLGDYLTQAGAAVERIGRNVLARGGGGPGRGPRLLLNSHYDTVPAGPDWTRDPWEVSVEDGRVYGLGSNDAKASVAAMTGAFLGVLEAKGPCEVALLIAAEEETGGEGTEVAWPVLRDSGWIPDGVVVGEPTGLDVAIAQKGLLILELEARGDGGHSANAASRSARNAIFELARDLRALEELELGEHPFLGPTTLQPTQTEGGEARNMVPARARCLIDLRTVPGVSHRELVDRVRQAVGADVKVVSDRLHPRECPSDAAIVAAAREARPRSELFGSATLSDLVYFEDVPAIKCGPGRTERSHQPDEFVLESEVTEGLAFYQDLIVAFAGGAKLA